MVAADTGSRRRRWLHTFDLVWVLTRRNIRLRYRGAVLGLAWAQLAPLAHVGVLVFLFTRIVPLGVKDYPVFLLVGLLVWNAFSSGLQEATDAVVGGRDLLRHPGFATELLPAVAVSSQLIHYVLSLPAVAVMVLATGNSFHLTLVALPLLLGVQFVLMLGPAFVLSATQVALRDVGHLLRLLLAVGFYATPVMYPRARVPGRFRWLYDLNPASQLVDAHRAVLIDGRWPRPAPLVVMTLVGVLGAFIGLQLFRRWEPTFVEQL